MATWLNELTPEQKALLPKQRDKWIALGLSTEPANRVEAEAGVRMAYEAAGLSAPAFMIWVDSPYAGAFAQAIAPGIIEATFAAAGKPVQVRAQVRAQVGAQVRDQVRAQVGAQVRDQVRAQVWDQVGAQVRDQVRAQVGDQVWDQVGDQVRDQVRAQVRAQVGDQVRDQVGDQVRDQVGAQVWDQVGAKVGAQVRAKVRAQVRAQVWDQVRDQVRAQVGAQVGAQVRAKVRAQVGAQVQNWGRALISDYYGIWWSSWIETMRALGVTGLDPWEGQERVAANAYWWWCFKGFVVLSERPRLLKRDAEGRLHAEGVPAIEFPDGWAIHAWHGTRVPADFWEWDIARVMEERNDEIRRAGIERIGWHEFLNGLTLLKEADDPGNEGMKLALFDLDSEAGRRLLGDDDWEELPRLIVMDNASLDRGGHRRRYSRLVPGTVTDPVEGIAASYGLTRDQYAVLEAAR